MAGLLRKIVNGQDDTHQMLIEDSIHHNGRPLLINITYQFAKRFNKVYILLTDTSIKEWTRYIDSELTQNVNFSEWKYDRWTDGGMPPNLSDSFTFLQYGSEDGAVIIDNLSTILLHYNYTQLCSSIQRIGKCFKAVCCLLHYDVHGDHVIQGLHHMMSSIIRTLPCSLGNATKCSILHKHKNGKITRQNEIYSLVNGDVISHTEIVSEKIHKETLPSVDPAANLTFDLRLTEKEKHDRSQVILPYTASILNSSKSNTTNSSGTITYQLDEADDWDESDPDDDLDI